MLKTSHILEDKNNFVKKNQNNLWTCAIVF